MEEVVNLNKELVIPSLSSCLPILFNINHSHCMKGLERHFVSYITVINLQPSSKELKVAQTGLSVKLPNNKAWHCPLAQLPYDFVGLFVNFINLISYLHREN